jgi:formate hydrogenlyase subunit 4
MMVTESSRVPVDDPNTHLELTMIHEVMILDNSGPDLAMLNYAAGIKMVVLGSLIAALVTPFEIGLIYGTLIFIGILIFLAVAIGCIESLVARFRMMHIPRFILFMTSIALIVLSIIQFSLYEAFK